MNDETPEPQPDERTPLERLAAAVQEFASEMAEQPVLVHQALVVWEYVRYDDHGEAVRKLSYTLPMDGSSVAGALGLAAAGDQMLRRDSNLG